VESAEEITSAVVQGILQGESVPKIAERFRNVAEMDYKASIRDARTSVTSAQNAGRIEAIHRAENMGIRMLKQWLATLDDRTKTRT
jgi:Phage Mu protein F like protein.